MKPEQSKPDGVVPPEMKVSVYSTVPVSVGIEVSTAKKASSPSPSANASPSTALACFSSLKRRLKS